jgi:ABC-type dipeptide/oligopeptide/nickel transport system permease subunit
VAFVVTFFTTIIGVLIGATSGDYGGWIDETIQRFVEFIIAGPLLPLLLAFSALLRGVKIPGLPSEWSIAVIITIILIDFFLDNTRRFNSRHGTLAAQPGIHGSSQGSWSG